MILNTVSLVAPRLKARWGALGHVGTDTLGGHELSTKGSHFGDPGRTLRAPLNPLGPLELRGGIFSSFACSFPPSHPAVSDY